VLAPDSAEFHAAKEINARFCSNMEVAYGLGTHYSILQGPLAPKTAGCILNFMRRLGHSVPQAPAVPDVPGLMTLHSGEGPRVYMVHGLDTDLFGTGASYSALAPMLAPCHACAVAYDDEAVKCDSLPELGGLILWRIAQDRARNPEAPVFIAGYSFGCVIAHQVALLAHQYGMPVSLILVDFEVTYPPGGSTQRIGGYDWLGGATEAALLIARSMGGVDGVVWAAKEAEELLSKAPEKRDVQDIQQRAFDFISSKRRGFGRTEFNEFCDRGGRNIQQIHTITGKWEPGDSFAGETLLVLAPDSAEFHAAKEINARFCSNMEVAYGLGTHYSILQGPLAPKTAGCILNFMRRLGHSVPQAPAVPDVPGLMTLHSGEGPRVYMVHGLDTDLFGTGASYSALAPMLAPCNTCLLRFDADATSSDSLLTLAQKYLMRIVGDMQQNPSAQLVIVGSAFGCVIAHQIALQMQQHGAQVSLVLIDFEVSYPPGKDLHRFGGYDWLGGEFEATLQMVRSVGCVQWAAAEAERLQRLAAPARDITELRKRAFAEHASKLTQFTRADFDSFCSRGGHCMDLLHGLVKGWAPPGKFTGATLLVLAAGSGEFHAARDVNAQFCTSMETVEVAGTAYSILEPERPSAVAAAVLSFLRKHGHAVPAG